MDKLRECPFCGREGTLFGQEDIYVYCKSCTQFCDSKEKAINNWNTRAYDAEIAELKARLSLADTQCTAFSLVDDNKQLDIENLENEIAELKAKLDIARDFACYVQKQSSDVNVIYEAEQVLAQIEDK